VDIYETRKKRLKTDIVYKESVALVTSFISICFHENLNLGFI
jgi:hypothetical protein